MKIEEAPKLLKQDLDNPGSVPIENLNEAQELGIEALEFVTTIRKCAPINIFQPLLGETWD